MAAYVVVVVVVFPAAARESSRIINRPGNFIITAAAAVPFRLPFRQAHGLGLSPRLGIIPIHTGALLVFYPPGYYYYYC